MKYRFCKENPKLKEVIDLEGFNPDTYNSKENLNTESKLNNGRTITDTPKKKVKPSDDVSIGFKS